LDDGLDDGPEESAADWLPGGDSMLSFMGIAPSMMPCPNPSLQLCAEGAEQRRRSLPVTATLIAK
jgi:hypothetical protein